MPWIEDLFIWRLFGRQRECRCGVVPATTGEFVTLPPYCKSSKVYVCGRCCLLEKSARLLFIGLLRLAMPSIFSVSLSVTRLRIQKHFHKDKASTIVYNISRTRDWKLGVFILFQTQAITLMLRHCMFYLHAISGFRDSSPSHIS